MNDVVIKIVGSEFEDVRCCLCLDKTTCTLEKIETEKGTMFDFMCKRCKKDMEEETL